MILVDTSVLVDWFRRRNNPKAEAFAKILDDKTTFAISILTYQELLRGVKNEAEYALLKNYLEAQNIIYLPNTLEFYRMPVNIYRYIRTQGETVRSSIDLLIASTAIYHEAQLLHNDKDFDVIANFFPSRLMIYR
ncbi:MAG: PIN domain-containing protein [Clostridiales bacterium]|jgi:predicted nucleic acid-binding protein|nr:PIN domain-containing protein [Clostridiales bacterium]